LALCIEEVLLVGAQEEDELVVGEEEVGSFEVVEVSVAEVVGANVVVVDDAAEEVEQKQKQLVE
jgi:hypothetical protein